MKKDTRVSPHSQQKWIQRFQQARVPMLTIEEVQGETLPVSISQTSDAFMYRIDPWRAGFAIPMRCAPLIPRGVAVTGFEVVMPFGEFRLQELEDPLKLSGEYYYCVTERGGHEYHRDEVINHHFPGVLHPGRGWDGLLLGILWGQFPKQFASPIQVKVVLFDDSGRTASAMMEVLVSHKIMYVPEPVNSKNHGGLFEPLEQGDAQERDRPLLDR